MTCTLRRATLAAGLLLVVPLAHAAEAAPSGVDMGAGLLQATLGLAFVLALVIGAAWLVRRASPSVGGNAGLLRIVAARAVGQRERVVVVEIEDQWLVLGVAPGRVNTLTALPRGTLPASPASVPPFAAMLARALGRKNP